MIKPEILIVDDLKQNLIAMEALLIDCEALVTSALSGNEALTLMLKHEFAIVLLDVQMPGMDGFEVAELMRMKAETQHIPIIFVTAINKEQRYVFKGYEAGAVDFLSKPIDPEILRSKVNVFLDLWRQRHCLAQALAENERITTQLKYQAEFDSLTGLPNRYLFHDRLKQAILASDRSENFGALMFIDLDNFKRVNDTLGHEAGDDLLVQVAERLQKAVRESDTVARIGGDEFTVIVHRLNNQTIVKQIATKILTELAVPFTLKQQEVHISGSIGMTLFPTDSSNVEELLKNADIAMYKAKSSGRNNCRYFTQEMNSSVEKRMLLETELHKALERDEFRLHYQPKVDLTTGLISGMEALIRWQRPGHDLVYPDTFIALAEEVGLIIPISKWVLRTACLQCRQWQDEGFKNLSMSVNISPRHFDKKNELLQDIHETLSVTGLDPVNLELEITEHLMMKNLHIAREVLEELQEMKISIAIDDFGTGYSSLASLKQFPIQTLKIDKSFIRDLTVDSDDAAIVAAIIAMADKLSLAVVAEGVENKSQLDFLIKQGCKSMQGFYFSKPLLSSQCLEILQDRKSLESVE